MKKTAILAAKKAGEYILKNFNKVKNKDIKDKGGFSGLVSKVDIEAEKIIKKIILKKFPDHNILGEESGKTRKKSDYTWVVDPLDGTHNYLMGSPLFCTAIALTYKNEVILGVIYAPYLKEMFWAEKDKGSFLNGKKIKVSKKTNISQSLFYFCHGYEAKHVRKALKIYNKLKMKATDIRQLGTGGIETAWVAAGRAEGFVIPGGKPWDIAPGILLVKEAGGKATDFKNKDWNLKSKDMICSNGKIHHKFFKFIK